MSQKKWCYDFTDYRHYKCAECGRTMHSPQPHICGTQFKKSTNFIYNGPMKIITFNIQTMFSNLFPWSEHYWRDRAERINAIVREEQPDILCVQESRRPQLWRLDEVEGYDRVGKHQLPFITQHCGILYKTVRFEFVSAETNRLPDSKYRRMYTKAVLRDKVTGEWNSFYNAHISWGEDGDRQFKMLSDIVLDDRNRAYLCGDLNAEGRETATKLHNLAYEGGTYHGYADNPDGWRPIDYIFTNWDKRHTTKVIHDLEASDHFPIVATIGI